MRRVPRVLVALLATAAALGTVRAQAPKPAAGVPAPSRATVITLADLYLGDATKKFTLADRELMNALKGRFRLLELQPWKIRETIQDLVSVLTLALAETKSANALTAASAFLVKLDPDNPRVTNLFGSVLHSTNRLRDAVTVLELTAAQSPEGVLARVNLANAYLDVALNAKAKAEIDKALRMDPDNQQAWRAMATYWYQRKNMPEFQKALLRGASFEGYVRRETREADVPVDANEVKPTDVLATMERKAAALSRSVPLSTADLVQTADPMLARRIRDRAGKLLPGERMQLPLFPQVNTSSTRGWAEGMPVVAEWMKAFAERYADGLKADALARTGIRETDDSATVVAKAMAAANAELSRSLGNAQDILKYMKGADLPGVPKGQINQAMSEVTRVASENNVKLSSAPVNPDRPPGFDYGTPFAKANYRNYLVVSRSLEAHIGKYFEHFDGEEKEILRIYRDKAEVERLENQRQEESIDRQYVRDPYGTAAQQARLREKIRYARAMNLLGDQYFKLWVNLYVPEYTQKMKPMLENYWSTCILYVRNMHDLEVVSREYARVRGFYLQQTMKASTYAGDGAAFTYMASEAELAAMEAEIRRMEAEEVPKQSAVILRDFKVHTLPAYDKPHEKDWVDFIGENLHYELKAQFIGVKMTAQSIEFDFWAFGPAAGIKFDFVDEKMETYVGLKAKWEVGVKVAGVDVGMSADGEFAKRTSSWDFLNGKYSEGYPPPQAHAGIKATAGNFSLKTDGKYEYGKGGSATAGAKAGFGPLEGSGEISYTPDKGFTAKSEAEIGAGPVKASASAELDAQLNSRASASVGVSGQGLSTQRDFSLTRP